jgi:septum formation protein
VTAPIILASTSPRRRDLLALLRIPFEVADPSFPEHPPPDAPPDQQALTFAREKARSVAARFPDRLVMGSDTLIALGPVVFGKPAGAADARRILRSLSGRVHVIHTAVGLVRFCDKVQQVGIESVMVRLRELSDADIEAYVRSGEGMEKAGAYSIQGAGAGLIADLSGDFTAAVGLPLRLTGELLKTCGVAIGVDLDELYRVRPYPNWSLFNSSDR